jgi:hypothetical protein
MSSLYLNQMRSAHLQHCCILYVLAESSGKTKFLLVSRAAPQFANNWDPQAHGLPRPMIVRGRVNRHPGTSIMCAASPYPQTNPQEMLMMRDILVLPPWTDRTWIYGPSRPLRTSMDRSRSTTRTGTAYVHANYTRPSAIYFQRSVTNHSKIRSVQYAPWPLRSIACRSAVTARSAI